MTGRSAGADRVVDEADENVTRSPSHRRCPTATSRVEHGVRMTGWYVPSQRSCDMVGHRL